MCSINNENHLSMPNLHFTRCLVKCTPLIHYVLLTWCFYSFHYIIAFLFLTLSWNLYYFTSQINVPFKRTSFVYICLFLPRKKSILQVQCFISEIITKKCVSASSKLYLIWKFITHFWHIQFIYYIFDVIKLINMFYSHDVFQGCSIAG